MGSAEMYFLAANESPVGTNIHLGAKLVSNIDLGVSERVEVPVTETSLGLLMAGFQQMSSNQCLTRQTVA